MGSAATVLPPFPIALKKYLKQPAALSATEIIEHMRQRRTEFHNQNAEALDRHQQYLDALAQALSQTLAYLNSQNTVTIPNPSGEDNSVTLDGTPVSY